MFACWMCSINDARSATTLVCGFVGVFLSFAISFAPLRRDRRCHRGETGQPVICDIPGLAILLAPTCLVILAAITSNATSQTIPLSAGLIATVLYVWLRCRYILDSFNITRARLRFLFVGVALPCIFIAGFIAGDRAFFLPMVIGSGFILDYTISAAVTIVILSLIAFLSLCVVFPKAYRYRTTLP